MRELEIIGEASRQLSDETRKSIPGVNWTSVIGMRNRLIHGYFDVDYDVVWETILGDLPQLDDEARVAADRLGPRVHPWRICPIGKHWVRTHPRHKARRSGTTEVEGHCRLNRSGKDQLYPDEIRRIARERFQGLAGGPADDSLGHSSGSSYDLPIRGWTRYWNDILGTDAPLAPLDPDIVKALIASESGFQSNQPSQNAGAAGRARGLMQLTDQAIRALGDEKGELKDHLVGLSRGDAREAEIAICAGVRWLFHKRGLAGHRLKRPAGWEEAVAEYKAYLRDMLNGKNPNPDGMVRFRNYLARLRGNSPK